MKVSETFWLTVVGFIQDGFILIAIILFFLIPKDTRRPYLEPGIILIIALVVEVASWVGILAFHRNMNLAHVPYALLNLPLGVWFYRRQVQWRSRDLIAYTISAVYIGFTLFNIFYIQGLHGYNSWSSSLAAFCYIIIAMTWHFGYALSLPKEIRTKLPLYWMNLGILFYYSTIFYINLWADYLINVKQSRLINLWIVHNSLGLVYYSILCYSFILIRKQALPKPEPK